MTIPFTITIMNFDVMRIFATALSSIMIAIVFYYHFGTYSKKDGIVFASIGALATVLGSIFGVPEMIAAVMQPIPR